MAQRLVDVYQEGDVVEIMLNDGQETQWRSARVRALQHPGVWGQTVDGRLWFVTNGKRIRRLAPPEPPPA